MLSSSPLRLSPRSPWSSALSVLLFYCRTLSFGQSSYVFLLYPASNQCLLSLYGSVLFLIGSLCLLFPFMDTTHSWLASSPFCSPIRTPLQSPYIRCLLYCIVSLVSSMQSSIVSSPNLKGNRPLRDLCTCTCSCFTSFISLTRVRWDLELSSIRIQDSSILCHHTRASSSHLCSETKPLELKS